MIVEERDYRLVPGRLHEFISTYEAYGLDIQRRHLGGFLGYFITEIGELNHAVAWWSYESLADRDVRRARMLADTEWSGYLGRVAGLIDIQSTRILKPVCFSPLPARLAPKMPS